MEFHWTSTDDIKIFAKEWAIEKPKAVIALVHGFGEHIIRYDSMANYYNKNGYAVIGSDHRGHGQSDGKRGHTPHYDRFLDELDELVEVCMEKYPGVPIVLYGHSMGGNLVLNYMLQRPKDSIKLTVVTSPWIRLYKEPPAILKWIARQGRKIAPTFSQGQKIGTYVSRVKEEVDKYNNDPLNHGTISFSMADEMMQSCQRLEAYNGPFPSPLLIQHAGDDHITNPKSSEAFYNSITTEKDFKIWEGLYHEIHNESIREQVYDFTIDWLNNKV